MQQTDKRMQGAFDKVVEQGLKTVTSEEASAGVAQDAMSRGAGPAIVEAVVASLNGVRQAAEQSGVKLPPEVMQSAAVAMAQVMVSMMVDAGMADDPDALLKEVVQSLKEG